ncbi:hypothetical protein EDD11_003068 [Mortierella claussenii]|nr:hypothetical protein EDD11_003068 [Mortierella claussenii]
MSASEEVAYHAKAPIQEGLKAGAIGAGAGLFVAAAQNTMGTHSHGALGIFTRSGATIGAFAVIAGVFAATDSVVANARETKDAWNSAAAGCASGLVVGAYQRTGQAMLLGCLGMGAAIAAFDLSGSSLKGKYAEVTAEKKDEWRKSQVNTK